MSESESAQKSLADYSDSFFRSLLEAAPDAMVIVDADGKIVVVNSQTEKMFGYLRDEMVGESIEMLLPSEARKKHVNHRGYYVANPHVRPMGKDLDLIALRRDGSTFAVEISLSPLRVENGSYVSSVIRDVTERKAIESELISARQEAERANKANTAFLAAASHDLRQPVQALTLLNGALRRTTSDANTLEIVDSQQRSLDTMTNLLNSLLDISRLDAGAIEPTIEVFPVKRLFDNIVNEFGRQAAQKGLQLLVSDAAEIVESDPNLVAEILQNLVANAIRYTSDGAVHLQSEMSELGVTLRVIDTGIGLDPKNLQDIFVAFHQIRAPGQATEGFGLGLAIVKRLAELLGCRVDVKSTLGEGSEFSLWLPRAAEQCRAKEGLESSHDNPNPSTNFEDIILIEDDVAVAQAMTALLVAEGYRVTMATTAGEASDSVRKLARSPSLIVTDYFLLDDSTGVEAIACIRKICGREIPAFVITGDTSVVGNSIQQLQNCAVLRKPVSPNQLLHDIAAAISTQIVPTLIDP